MRTVSGRRVSSARLRDSRTGRALVRHVRSFMHGSVGQPLVKGAEADGHLIHAVGLCLERRSRRSGDPVEPTREAVSARP